jgi:hypothetical protein
MSDLVKVKIQNWGYADTKPGDTVEVEPHVANALVGSGHATAANKTAEKAVNPAANPNA